MKHWHPETCEVLLFRECKSTEGHGCGMKLNRNHTTYVNIEGDEACIIAYMFLEVQMSLVHQ